MVKGSFVISEGFTVDGRGILNSDFRRCRREYEIVRILLVLADGFATDSGRISRRVRDG